MACSIPSVEPHPLRGRRAPPALGMVAVVHSSGCMQRGSAPPVVSGYFSPCRAAVTSPGGVGGEEGRILADTRPPPSPGRARASRVVCPPPATVVGGAATRHWPAEHGPSGGAPLPRETCPARRFRSAPPPLPLPRGRASARLCRRPSPPCSPFLLGSAAGGGISRSPRHASSRWTYRPVPLLSPPSPFSIGFFSSVATVAGPLPGGPPSPSPLLAGFLPRRRRRRGWPWPPPRRPSTPSSHVPLPRPPSPLPQPLPLRRLPHRLSLSRLLPPPPQPRPPPRPLRPPARARRAQ